MVDDLTDQEKSVLLVEAIGWKVVVAVPDMYTGIPFQRILFPDGKMESVDAPLNLYDPANMALAWRVLNWASQQKADIDDYSYPYYFAQGVEWLFDTDEEIGDQIWAKSPVDAQKLWLDKILELAIEAGLVELKEGVENA